MKPVADNESSISDPSPFGRLDYITVTIFGFALNVLWTPMGAVIMPLLVSRFVADSQKNTYLGLITFAGLILAMIVQPAAGAISDRSGFVCGRRRPYILIGSIAAIALLMSFAADSSLVAVLLFYCLLQIASNTAHGPWQGFIPDLVPGNKRGVASAVKGIMETLGAVVGLGLAGYFLSERFAGAEDSRLLLALGAIAILIAGAMIITVLAVREKPVIGVSKISLSQILWSTFQIDTKISSSFLFFLISRFLFLMPLIVLRTFGLYFLKDVAENADPVAVASDLMIAVGVSLLIVIYPAGYLSDVFGKRRIVIASGIIGAAGFALFLFAQTYLSIMLVGVLLGMANGCFMSANWAMATDLVAKGEEARHLGLTNLATGGACAVAAFAGPVIDFFNVYGHMLGYQIVVVACILFSIMSSVLVTKIRTNGLLLQSH